MDLTNLQANHGRSPSRQIVLFSLDWNRYFLSDPLSAVLQAEEMADRIMAY
ncbi:hypothetical protein [Paenibacillus sp. Z3-2]